MHYEKSTCSKLKVIVCFLFPILFFYPLFGSAQDDPAAVPTPVKEAEAASQLGLDVIELEYKVNLPVVTPCPKDQVSSVPCAPNVDSSDLVKNFKMLAPVDWEVETDYGIYAFYMSPKVKAVPTAETPIAVDPNLAIAVSKNPISIDESGLESLAIKIEEEINKDPYGTERPNKFKIYQKILIDVAPGRQGYLYYTYGTMGNLKLRQAILVLSTDLVAYRVVLTDVEANFDKTLQKIYPIMASINLQGLPPKREDPLVAFLPWIIGVLSALFLFVMLKVFMVRKSRRLIAEVSMDSEDDVAPSSDAPKSGLPVSDVTDD